MRKILFIVVALLLFASAGYANEELVRTYRLEISEEPAAWFPVPLTKRFSVQNLDFGKKISTEETYGTYKADNGDIVGIYDNKYPFISYHGTNKAYDLCFLTTGASDYLWIPTRVLWQGAIEARGQIPESKDYPIGISGLFYPSGWINPPHPQTTPEPASFILFGLGGLVIRLFKRKN